MAGERDKANPWLPRWSVRMLLIVVTLACMYLACWGPTKNQGVKDVGGGPSAAIAPLIVETPRWGELFPDGAVYGGRCYYFWFFGYVAKLPFERDVGGLPRLGFVRVYTHGGNTEEEARETIEWAQDKLLPPSSAPALNR